MQSEFSLGAHLTAPRRTCVHHGVYVGNGRVIHNKWLVFNFTHCGVCEVSLAEFSLGRPITQQVQVNATFTPEEIVARARSRLGEQSYDLITNNCEHFTRWCLTGVSRSLQIEMWHARFQFATRWFSRSRNSSGHQACQQQT
jgi:HRAS-like suppressor 3